MRTRLRKSRHCLKSAGLLLTLCAAVFCGATTPQSSTTAAASPVASAEDQKTIKDFQTSVNEYIKIKQHAPAQAHLKKSADVHEIEHRRDELKKTIRNARPNAKQGDIFTEPVSALFRRLMSNALNGPNGNKLRRSLQHAEPGAAAEESKLKVDEDFPNKHGQPLQSSPVTLLENLPVLPKTLEYRIVGTTLVMRDSEANLVVDYLPHAIKE